jgi:hypothetical protein
MEKQIKFIMRGISISINQDNEIVLSQPSGIQITELSESIIFLSRDQIPTIIKWLSEIINVTPNVYKGNVTELSQ